MKAERGMSLGKRSPQSSVTPSDRFPHCLSPRPTFQYVSSIVGTGLFQYFIKVNDAACTRSFTAVCRREDKGSMSVMGTLSKGIPSLELAHTRTHVDTMRFITSRD